MNCYILFYYNFLVDFHRVFEMDCQWKKNHKIFLTIILDDLRLSSLFSLAFLEFRNSCKVFKLHTLYVEILFFDQINIQKNNQAPKQLSSTVSCQITMETVLISPWSSNRFGNIIFQIRRIRLKLRLSINQNEKLECTKNKIFDNYNLSCT